MSAFRILFLRLRTLLLSLGTFLARILRATFGVLHWTPPAWIRWTIGRAGAGIRTATTHIKGHPRQSAALGAAALILIGAAYGGWRWYQSLPKPVLTEYTFAPPPVTCYACKPPGRPNPLLVTFANSVAPLNLVGKDLDAKSTAIRLSPALKGTWHWDGQNQLSFTPAQDWPIGADVTVSMARSGLVAGQIHLKDYSFKFKTPAFIAKIEQVEFNQDPVVAANKKVVVNVSFTHPIAPKDFEPHVVLTLFEKQTDQREVDRSKVPFTVIYDALHLNAYIHSAQLAVPNKMGRLSIQIQPGLQAARGGNTTRDALQAGVPVPGLYSLTVKSMSLQVVRDEREEPSQALLIQMSHSVKERDMPAVVHAWVLPQKHPDPRIQAAFEKHHRGPYIWSRETLTPEILQSAEVLPLTQIPGELEHAELQSFRHSAEPGRSLYVRVDKQLQSFGGYRMADTASQLLRVPNYPREIKIAQQGSLLAFSGTKTLTVLTRDLPAMRVEVGRLLPRQIQHLVSQTGGSFSQPSFQGWGFQDDEITERFTKVVRLPTLKPGTAHYEALPLSQYLAEDASDRRGIFLLKVQGWNPETNRPISGSADAAWNSVQGEAYTDTRLVVITDLGLLRKQSLDGSQDLFVQSIHTGEPLADVHIDVLGRNGLPVISGTTDPEGHVHFADLRSFKREQAPTVYLARRGGDSSFLPVEERDRALNLSRFDIGGIENRLDPGALSAYLFSDRGLYRPGEEIRIGAIVRAQNWQRDLKGIPLRLEITDPRGIPLRSEPFTPGAAGFGEILQSTRETSPAGTYTIALSLVRAEGEADPIGSTTVQVRDFQPDRLRMSTHFSTERPGGWVSPESLSASVSLHNLFGTPAANRRITAQMSLSPALPAFPGYADYHFFDPQATEHSFEDTLSVDNTDEKGEARLALHLERFAKATYRVDLTTQGFEADGGRGVSSAASQLVSNMPYLVGWKADGSLAYVSRNAQRAVQVIAVDPGLKKTEVKGLKLSRIETRYVSALVQRPNGTYQYQSRRKDITLDSQELAVPSTGARLPLATATPGMFAYVITDSAGQTLGRIEYRVAGDANLTRTLEKDAELQIALSHTDYKPGEDIEMQIQAPYTGAGLITIERDKVYAWKWFRSKTTSSTQHIRLPEGMEGNAYVHVAFVRDPDSEEIYTSPLSYGVQPFSINLDARKNPVKLEVPALVKPGRVLKIAYSSQRPSHLVLFAVDEGILQVAAYRTPDPLGHFFQKRALAVGTTQILDLILPEYRGARDPSAAGGDADGSLSRHLNPFRRKGDKPVAYWSGLLEADSTPRTAEYTVPDYFNGSLRVMAVAVSDEAIGVQKTSTTSRGDFVLSPNAPTTVTPGDEFEVSVGVANNLAGSGPNAQVTVTLQTGPGLQLLDKATQRIPIPENREGAARFRVRALDTLGAADLGFTAGSGASSVRRHIDLSIRPATPYRTSLTAGILKHTRKDVPRDRSLYPEYRSLEASTALTPLSLSHGLTAYLAHYPWACTEQLVSRALPALLLTHRPEFGYVRSSEGASLPDLINELRVRQNEDGAYRLWPGGDEVADFPSLYAQHFLLEAASRGERVPADLLHRGNTYLQTLAARDGDNLDQERDTAYALYLLTRQGTVVSAEAAALRKRLTERYKGRWEQDLTAAWLAAALKVMHQDKEADALIQALRFNATPQSSLYQDPMTREAWLLYLLARHFPDRLTSLPADVLERMAQRITANTYDSLSAATTLMALETYASATQVEGEAHLSIAEVLSNKTIRPLTLPSGLLPKVAFSDAATALQFGSDSDLPAFYLMTQSGFDRTAPTQAQSNGFEILHEITDANGRSLTQIRMGEEAQVHLKVRALNERANTQVALVDLLPGGFELVQSPLPVEDTYQQEGEVTVVPRCTFCRTSPEELNYADPREDRIVFYTHLTGDIQEFVYRIKATNVGRYALPPAFGEAMYDRSLNAHSAAAHIEVIRP